MCPLPPADKHHWWMKKSHRKHLVCCFECFALNLNVALYESMQLFVWLFTSLFSFGMGGTYVTSLSKISNGFLFISSAGSRISQRGRQSQRITYYLAEFLHWKHCSRMRTARFPTVSQVPCFTGGVVGTPWTYSSPRHTHPLDILTPPHEGTWYQIYPTPERTWDFVSGR